MIFVQCTRVGGNALVLGGVWPNMSGVWILVGVAVLLAAYGLWRAKVDGRMSRRGGSGQLTADQVGAHLGERATLVQFTSAFCAPCRATRRILGEVAQMVPGVRHLDLDVEEHLDLARELNVSRTPTVLVLDAEGAIVTRASGQPRKADIIAALGEAIPA